MKTLFLPMTPFHTFVSLGLMAGPFKGGQHHLALLDRRSDGNVDQLAMALRNSEDSGVSLTEFASIKKLDSRQARRVLESISELTAALQPSVIAVGNDLSPEFYAAVRGCPSAKRVYLDDGLNSYFPHNDAESAWVTLLSAPIRRLRYGLTVERPSMLGGSRAIQEGYVLLPQRVHAGLRAKRVEALRREWFADPWVRSICNQAASATGFDGPRCSSIDLLLLLPHPRFLKAYPELKKQMEDLAAGYAASGRVVAIKAHPRARIPIQRQLKLPQQDLLEIPAGLPVEAMVPLLTRTLVVGALTTALMSLATLGEGLKVRFLQPPKTHGTAGFCNDQTLEIYRSVGIETLDGTDPPAH